MACSCAALNHTHTHILYKISPDTSRELQEWDLSVADCVVDDHRVTLAGLSILESSDRKRKETQRNVITAGNNNNGGTVA